MADGEQTGGSKTNTRRNLQLLLGAFGAVCVAIALTHILLGPSSIPGSVPVNATMDSEDRFYATLFLGFGATLLWCVRGVERKRGIIGALMVIFFLGGVARIISIFAVGLPGLLFVFLTVVELVLPMVVMTLQYQLARAVDVAPSTSVQVG